MNNKLPSTNRYNSIDHQRDDLEKIVQDSSYERLIYTAITRTSHYLFISSSKEDRNCVNIKKEHPLFDKLREWIVEGDMKIVPYNEEKHGMLNAKIKKHKRTQQ
jgi:hypothetical protein